MEEAPSGRSPPAHHREVFRPSLPKIVSATNLEEEGAGALVVGNEEEADSYSTTTASGSETAVCPAKGTCPLLLQGAISRERSASPSCWFEEILGVSGREEWQLLSSPQQSVASSGRQYAEPTQTLIFLDWDDTLFPCTELFQRWGLERSLPSGKPAAAAIPAGLEAELEKWRAAVHEYLAVACALTDRCVIVTNSRRPWVETCVRRFAPNLLSFFDGTRRGPRVAYADEVLRQCQTSEACSGSCFSGVLHDATRRALSLLRTAEAQKTELMEAKLMAMRREAVGFYSRYPGQTWKNLLSIGDRRYERDALIELSASRVPSAARERLRTKALVIPGAPTLSQLTLWLRLLRLLLPALVRLDGDVDVDLCAHKDPMKALGKALTLPHLGALAFPWLAPPQQAKEARRTAAEEDEEEEEVPASYRLTSEAALRAAPNLEAAIVQHLHAGMLVEVLETHSCVQERFVHGRLGAPAGWVILRSTRSGHRWADREDESAVEEALDEVAVAVQDAIFRPALCCPGSQYSSI